MDVMGETKRVFRAAGSAGKAGIPLVMGCWLWCATAPAEMPLPTASEVTQRMIERSAAVAQETEGPRYACAKHTRVEHLDGAGRTSRTEDKFYQVTWVAGFPFNRLTRVEGRDLTQEELEREQRREERFQERMTSLNPRRMAARREGWVTAALLDRFDFTVKERVMLKERPTLVLEFAPRRTEGAGHSLRDRLLGGLAGTVWVDEAEMEASRLEVRLAGTISVGWLGVLGSLSQCDLQVERQRMPEGAWVNVHQRLRVQARKLTTPIRFVMTEDYSSFRKADGGT